MSFHSQPVTFGLKLEGSVTTELSTCRLKTVDGHTYWINKYSVQNRTDPDCRTVTFSGTDVHFKITPCLSSSKPFCETSDTMLCKTSNKTDGIVKDWVRVAGQGMSYKLSSGKHQYCNAKYQCESRWHGQIAQTGNYTFMGLLAVELGIKGHERLDFWVDTPGISCPTHQGKASLMQYTGPLVHMIQIMNVYEQYQVLCENTVTSMMTGLAVLPSIPSSSRHTEQISPGRTSHPATSATARTGMLTSQAHSIIMKQSTKPPVTKVVPPASHSSQAQLKSGITIALSNTSEPVWLKVGQKEYFINCNSSAYKQMGNIVINYFKILAPPTSSENGLFWIGAHTWQDSEPWQDGLTYQVYKQGTVRYSLTNEQVQGMWRELRRLRNLQGKGKNS